LKYKSAFKIFGNDVLGAKMFVALVLPGVPSYSETFFTNKIRGLVESNHKVIVFTNGTNGTKGPKIECDVINGFSWRAGLANRVSAIAAVFFRLVSSPLRAFRLYRLNKSDGFSTRKNLSSLLSSAHILKFDPDWLHFGFAAVAIGRENLASVIGAKMAASIRGYDIAVYPLKNPGCYKLLWARLNKLHYISNDLYSLALQNGFDPETPHRKITPAVEMSKYERSRPGAFHNPLRIMTVARLHWKKGLEYALEGLKLLNDAGIDFRYTVVGDGVELERLVIASHQLGIADRVSFVGIKTPAETSRLLSESDVYLQYSIQEGFCNAVLEAQAAGLLCIVSDAEGLSENAIHGETGWVVPKRNPELLADRLIKVISLPEPQRAQVSRSAVERVRTHFNLEKQKLEFLRFYQ
jgi:glycosyltransferase involved in cell wall biosynthesis